MTNEPNTPLLLQILTMRLTSFIAALGLATAAFLSPPAHAGEGHDHGEAPAAAAGTALPRFAATSDLFELVGVLDGQKIALYLDHAGDNSPVKDARLELDIAGTNVPVTRVAEGEFQATLAAPLAEGVSPVTATVAAGTDTDLLAGEIDLHPAAHTDAAPAGLVGLTGSRQASKPAPPVRHSPSVRPPAGYHPVRTPRQVRCACRREVRPRNAGRLRR